MNSSTTNTGVSLPNGINATHNIGLSPLFITLAGRGDGRHDDDAILLRGGGGVLWAGTIKSIDAAYYFRIDHHDSFVRPSSFIETYRPHSLRCLVSTTNS